MHRVAVADPIGCLLKICTPLPLYWWSTDFVQVASLRNMTTRGAYPTLSKNLLVISDPFTVSRLEAGTWPCSGHWDEKLLGHLWKMLPCCSKEAQGGDSPFSSLSQWHGWGWGLLLLMKQNSQRKIGLQWSGVRVLMCPAWHLAYLWTACSVR